MQVSIIPDPSPSPPKPFFTKIRTLTGKVCKWKFLEMIFIINGVILDSLNNKQKFPA